MSNDNAQENPAIKVEHPRPRQCHHRRAIASPVVTTPPQSIHSQSKNRASFPERFPKRTDYILRGCEIDETNQWGQTRMRGRPETLYRNELGKTPTDGVKNQSACRRTAKILVDVMSGNEFIPPHQRLVDELHPYRPILGNGR